MMRFSPKIGVFDWPFNWWSFFPRLPKHSIKISTLVVNGHTCQSLCQKTRSDLEQISTMLFRLGSHHAQDSMSFSKSETRRYGFLKTKRTISILNLLQKPGVNMSKSQIFHQIQPVQDISGDTDNICSRLPKGRKVAEAWWLAVPVCSGIG